MKSLESLSKIDTLRWVVVILCIVAAICVAGFSINALTEGEYDFDIAYVMVISIHSGPWLLLAGISWRWTKTAIALSGLFCLLWVSLSVHLQVITVFVSFEVSMYILSIFLNFTIHRKKKILSLS